MCADRGYSFASGGHRFDEGLAERDVEGADVALVGPQPKGARHPGVGLGARHRLPLPELVEELMCGRPPTPDFRIGQAAQRHRAITLAAVLGGRVAPTRAPQGSQCQKRSVASLGSLG